MKLKKCKLSVLCPKNYSLLLSYEPDAGNPNSGLDFTIVAVSDKAKEGKNISDIPCTILDETLEKIIEGENCVVIQHPKGLQKNRHEGHPNVNAER